MAPLLHVSPFCIRWELACIALLRPAVPPRLSLGVTFVGGSGIGHLVLRAYGEDRKTAFTLPLVSAQLWSQAPTGLVPWASAYPEMQVV